MGARIPRGALLWLLALLAAAAVGVALLMALRARTPAQQVPLPRLPQGPVQMRVAHLVNARLPRMDDAQLAALLDSVRATARAHFGVEIVFGPVREIPIAAAFAAIPAKRREEAMREVYDFKSGRGDPERLARAFAAAFATQPEPLAQRVEFARPSLPALPARPSEGEFSAAVARLQLERLARWRDMRALDGGPAIDGSAFNEFMLWLALGYSELPYELVLTNQVIASVEYVLPAVHSAVRGGYTNGITTYSGASRWKTVSVWSTFAFTGNDDALVAWRGGERYTPLEAARLAGMAATHEIGHQLFHLTHPLGRPECLMNPVPMFAYRAWAEQLAPARCRLGSDAAMTPGAYIFNH